MVWGRDSAQGERRVSFCRCRNNTGHQSLKKKQSARRKSNATRTPRRPDELHAWREGIEEVTRQKNIQERKVPNAGTWGRKTAEKRIEGKGAG